MKGPTKLLIRAVIWPSEDLVGHKSMWPTVDNVMRMCEI